MKDILFLISFSLVSFMGYALYVNANDNLKGRGFERVTIKICWEEYDKRDSNLEAKQVVENICHSLENEFRKKYRTNP